MVTIVLPYLNRSLLRDKILGTELANYPEELLSLSSLLVL
jgi:hypothetical protein